MARKDPHAPYRELLATRLDRPLTRVELRRLATHLKTCASCQAADADYRGQRLRLRAMPEPMPPRDMWARTSAALDREVARGARTPWGRRVRRARRRAQPTSALMTTVAALGVITAIAVFQMAPPYEPATNQPQRPTPFAVEPQDLAFVGLGSSDLAVYQMTVSQVCPPTAPLDCVPAHTIVRTPIGAGQLPDIQAGNVALSPTGQRLALVGKQSDGDVIAVVLMPDENDSGSNPTNPVGSPETTETPEEATPTPDPTKPPATNPPPTDLPGDSPEPRSAPPSSPLLTSDPQRPTPIPPAPTPTPSPEPTETPTPEPTATPEEPPTADEPGLAVLNILEDVRSAGSPPAWSRNGEILAFSAMPIDGSHGPDVYIWSPNDTQARPITNDHASYFASWSGNRVVVGRLVTAGDGSIVSRNFVIDPGTLEERSAGGGQLWLPSVNRQRTRAVVWRGHLGTHDGQPELRSGGLFLMDWTSVDPFRPANNGAQPTPGTDADPGATGDPRPTPAAGGQRGGLNLVPLDPGRDARSAPVSDWQAGWSPDGRVLGIWIADSIGSNWGRLTVVAINPETGEVAADPLLATTLARRGFSLGSDRVAWVAPSDENLDGELRIRAWTSDGFGGVRVVSPEQEEVLPAF